MIISQILYTKGNETKNTVILVLGRKGDKTVCILDDKISKKEAEAIRASSTELRGYSLHNKLSWFKRNAPDAYRDGYRELKSTKIKVVKAYSIDEEKYVQVNL